MTGRMVYSMKDRIPITNNEFWYGQQLGIGSGYFNNFNWLGIKANYTYTYSKITTEKRVMQGSEVTTTTPITPFIRTSSSCSQYLFSTERQQTRMGRTVSHGIHRQTIKRYLQLGRQRYLGKRIYSTGCFN